MATIMEGALWRVSDAAAERMAENGLIVKCERPHQGATEDQRPIYHISCDAPKWFGAGSIQTAIISAEMHVEVNHA